MKKITKYISLIFITLLLHLYYFSSDIIKKVDFKFYDLTTNIYNSFNDQDSDSYTVIIDIDEKSLQELGQWPWPRILDAKLIDAIDRMNPSALGINILFPETDRVSPISIQKFYKDFFNLNVEFQALPLSLLNNDKLLYDSIKEAEATLSIHFGNNPYTKEHCKALTYDNNAYKNIYNILKAESLLCNNRTIQKDIENFGFINAWVDCDGIFRRTPLFMNYNQQVFPSFSLATVLSFDKYISIDTKNTTKLIDFSHKKPKIFSAVDILNHSVSSTEIQGKIVILSSSVIGLSPTYTISNGEKVSNSIIQAVTIDNIISNALISQPEIYKQINLFISLLLSSIIIFFVIKKLYINIVLLFFLTIVSSLFWLMSSYSNNSYISIGYLWLPFFSFGIMIIFYIINAMDKEQKQQEIFLIKQSKLASMGEMISLISHQWRQPLSSINGIILKLDIDHRNNKLNSEKINSYLNEVEDTTAYLSNTINDFTNFFSSNKRKEHFYLKDIIEQTINLTSISSYPSIKIIQHKDNNTKILGYQSELIQSLLIVLNNAIYACNKNFKQTQNQGQISIKDYKVNEKCFISIEDNGGGIDAVHLNEIFNPYFTTKDKVHGTGLGLYILRLIIEESMHGKVTIKNIRNGAMITIQIPSEIK